MDKLIDVLPQYILFFVLGFVFLRIFNYMCTIKNSENYEHIIWESVIVGFVLKYFYSLIPSTKILCLDVVGMTLSTIAFAGIFAKIYSCKYVDGFLRKIGVYRTRHKYIWQDIIDNEYVTFLRLENPNTNEAYYGAVKYHEDYEKHPQIALQYFKYWKNGSDNKPTQDFSNDPCCVALVDTNEFSKIFIIYQPNSDKVTKENTSSVNGQNSNS